MLGKMIVHGLVAAALIGAAAVAYAQMSGEATAPQATPQTTQSKEKTERYRKGDDHTYEAYGKYESRDRHRERHESRDRHEDRDRYEGGRRSRNN